MGDQRWLDLLDASGVMIWEEVTAWGNKVTDFEFPPFMAAQLASADAMVSQSFNNPSVVMWAFFNEGESDNNRSTSAYAAMSSRLRSRDGSRLVTWASNRQDKDLNFKFADIIAFNAYPGWYYSPPSAINAAWSAFFQWAAQHAPSKPMMISETGAGGIAGWRNGTCSLPGTDCKGCAKPGFPIVNHCWSEEFQELVVGEAIRTCLGSHLCAGITIWQLFDML